MNTGWTGGAYGVGTRMDLKYTRSIVHAILNGSLENAQFERDPIFGLEVPTSCPNVPASVLIPRNTWTDKGAYDVQAHKLFEMFEQNYKKFAN